MRQPRWTYAVSILSGAVLIGFVAVLAEAVLGSPSSPSVAASAPVVPSAAPAASRAGTIFDLGEVPTVTAPPPVPPPPSPTRSPGPPPTSHAVNRATALSLAGDLAGARAVLEPHVFGGHASDEEARMLQGICRAQHDQDCVDAIRAKYP